MLSATKNWPLFWGFVKTRLSQMGNVLNWFTVANNLALPLPPETSLRLQFVCGTLAMQSVDGLAFLSSMHAKDFYCLTSQTNALSAICRWISFWADEGISPEILICVFVYSFYILMTENNSSIFLRKKWKCSSFFFFWNLHFCCARGGPWEHHNVFDPWDFLWLQT